MASTGTRKLREIADRYISDFHPAAFPRATCYQALLGSPDRGVRESVSRRKAFPYSERHLHCVWFDPGLRPSSLCTRAGERITVEQPGTWNQEAGPDFLGAVLRIGPAERRMAGDVEIHIHPSDWKAHGHAADPRYRNVRFHVTYFPGAAKDIETVPGAVHVVLKEVLAEHPGFSFEHIDLSAYPYAARADMPRCSTVLAAYTPDQRIHVLRAAGEERLRRKAERMTDLIQEKGAEQTLYEEFMAGLGYKHNKGAFREVAIALTLEDMRRDSGHDTQAAYALLMGVAGLLPNQPAARWDAETAQFMRSLWDVWWRYRDQYATRPSRRTWRLDGVRPANHPARRLMAAAHLFAQPEPFADYLHRCVAEDTDRWMERILKYVVERYDPYASMRLGFGGTRRKTPVALIGRTRAASLCCNVIVPFLAASGASPARIGAALDRLPAEPDNGVIKQTAFYLFGRDHSPSLYKSALARQGLIQIFHDFCLNDRSRCASCAFPQALSAHLEKT